MKVNQSIEWVERCIVHTLAGRLDSVSDVDIHEDCVILIGKKKGAKKIFRINNTGKVTETNDRFVGRAIKRTVYYS